MTFRNRKGTTDGYILYRRWQFLGFEYRSDLIASDYMRRWIFKTPWGMIRLHHILRSDARDHFHDHPMDFTSIILRGGYVEHTPDHAPLKFIPGSVVTKRAEDLHYLELIELTAWTLVFAGPYRRDWGFVTEDGWIAAADYDAWKARRIS